MLASALDAYKRNGIGQIIRIVGQNVIGKMQFQRVTLEADIPVTYVLSLADADQLLAPATKR